MKIVDMYAQDSYLSRMGHHTVCGVAAELALVQCFAIRFLTNPKTIMQS